MTSTRELATQLSADVDRDAALTGLATYLDQINDIDDTNYGIDDDLPADILDYLQNAWSATDTTSSDVTKLGYAVDQYRAAETAEERAREDLDAAEQSTISARGARDYAIRAAIKAGVPVVDIATTTGLNRSRIYQIRDNSR